jgi:hypothetical protein
MPQLYAINAVAFDQDHFDIVKPMNRKADVYVWAQARIQGASNLARRGVSSTASVQERLLNQLNRHAFSQERGKQMGGATFLVQLKRPYTPDELGHFRILLEVSGGGTKGSSPTTLLFAARDGYFTSQMGGQLQKRDGTQTYVWARNPDVKFRQMVFSGGSSISGPNMSLIQVGFGPDGTGPFQTIESLNHTGLTIFVSESLADKMAGIGFAVDNYLLFGVLSDCLEQTKGDPVEWPFKLSQSEQAIGWLKLLPRRYWPDDNSRPPSVSALRRPGLTINFDILTPPKADTPGSWTIAPDCEGSDVGPLPPRW